MMGNIGEQRTRTQEALETALIVGDIESRYNASLELLKLNELEPLTDERLMYVRKRYGLNTAVWMLAEIELHKRKEF